ARLAARLHIPVLADPLSQVRCGTHDKGLIIDAYDAFLRDQAFTERHVPDVVLRFGAPPTSKPLTLYLERHLTSGHSRLVLVDPYDWRDPSHLASQVVVADAVGTCDAIEESLAKHDLPAPSPERKAWTTKWQNVNAVARRTATET